MSTTRIPVSDKSMHASESSPTRSAGARFGTFGGVFTPNVLTILGVIMFLRLGQVVGQAGLYDALLIILLAKLITSLTAVSLAGIATNTRVQGGGAYFLISRSLGVEFGGAIGIVFYLAQAISVAMYVIGFTDTLLYAFPEFEPWRSTIATAANVVAFICVFIGASWTIKVQYWILAALVISILSFAVGAIRSFSLPTAQENLSTAYAAGQSLFTMFALFFPAATGIMAGANMSGDLKTPDKSLPSGTFSAIGVTAGVYLLIAALLAGSAARGELITDNFVMARIAVVPSLITVGIFAATLSSALGSMMGAPRILQALAKDNVFPSLRIFARGSGESNEPRFATALTFLVAEIAILTTDLDLLAPIITMFFMVTYGTLNLACFYESYSGNPSFRPRFRFSHWSLSLAGAAGCAAAMLLMAPMSAVCAALIMWGLHRYIARSNPTRRWGDAQSGMAFEQARGALLRLEQEVYHPKNWRPTILALSGSVWNRYHLAEYGYWLAAGRGLLTFAQVVGGDVEDRLQLRERHERRLRQFIQKHELKAFATVVVDEDLLSGVKALLQCYGIGGIRPNTVLLGWSDDLQRLEQTAHLLRLIRDFKRSLIIVKCAEGRQPWHAPKGTIDVWWNTLRNGSLMLLLAHLLRQNSEFHRSRIRLMHVIGDESGRVGVTEHLQRLVRDSRIEADVEIVVGTDIPEQIRICSRSAAVAFLGFEPPDEGQARYFSDLYRNVVEHLETTILVCGAGDVDLEA